MIRLKLLLQENIDKTHEKLTKLFIYSVWRFMPKEDRFLPYQFSLWMDNDEKLQDLKSKIVNQLYPNDDDGYETFFYKDVEPTLERMEQARNNKLAKKINSNDPLFILKSIVQRRNYESAKKQLFKLYLSASEYKNAKIEDDKAETVFNRLYKHAMGETFYDEKYINNTKRLSDINKSTADETERIFLQYNAGFKNEKFPDKVKVWRGTNSPLNKIKFGDFVTFDKDYASSYATGKFKTIVSDILPSKDLRVYKLDVHTSELIYWPDNYVHKKFEGHIPTFKEFWQEFH